MRPVVTFPLPPPPESHLTLNPVTGARRIGEEGSLYRTIGIGVMRPGAGSSIALVSVDACGTLLWVLGF